MKPLTRADREFVLLAGAFGFYGVAVLIASVFVHDDFAIVLTTAAASAPVIGLSSALITPRQTRRFLEVADLAPQSVPKESDRGQLVRFVLASVLIALPLVLLSVVGLVALFDRVSERAETPFSFGDVVQGLSAGVFLGYAAGYVRLSLWMRNWQAVAGKFVWREAWPRRRTPFSQTSHTRRRAPVVRYYLDDV